MNHNTKIIGPDRPDTCTPTRTGDIIQGGPWDGFEVISTYSRAQAIADGVLVDLTDIAKEFAGFRIPVACTSGVWSRFVDASGRGSETEHMANAALMLGHLHAAITFAVTEGGEDVVEFYAPHVANGKPAYAWAKCHPGDNAEPVLTIMLEGED